MLLLLFMLLFSNYKRTQRAKSSYKALTLFMKLNLLKVENFELRGLRLCGQKIARCLMFSVLAETISHWLIHIEIARLKLSIEWRSFLARSSKKSKKSPKILTFSASHRSRLLLKSLVLRRPHQCPSTASSDNYRNHQSITSYPVSTFPKKPDSHTWKTGQLSPDFPQKFLYGYNAFAIL